MKSHDEKFKYLVIDAAGNIVLLIDVGSRAPAEFARFVTDAVAFKHGAAKIDIVGFVAQLDRTVYLAFYNPDGTPDKMCGNGCRSLPLAMKTWYGADRIGDSVFLVTDFCRARASLHADGSSSVEFAIEAIGISSRPATGDLFIDVGTPHVVRKADDLFSPAVSQEGQRLSTGALPVNATFCQVTQQHIIARTFERGVGETRSCGTGAIAAAVALDRWRLIAHLPNPRTVQFISGERLVVSLDSARGLVAIFGPCHLFATGEMPFLSKA